MFPCERKMVCGLQVGTGPKAIANDAVLMYLIIYYYFYFFVFTLYVV